MRILKIGLKQPQRQMVVEDRQHIVQTGPKGHAIAPYQRLVHGPVQLGATAQHMQKGHNRAQRQAKHRPRLGGVQQLIAGLRTASGIVDPMLMLTGEIATLDLRPDIAGEVTGHAHGRVEVGYFLILVVMDVAVEREHGPGAAVNLHVRVRMVDRTLAGLRHTERGAGDQQRRSDIASQSKQAKHKGLPPVSMFPWGDRNECC
jgi:hypothetical protein